jgi:MFS transporter, DHA1 family, inner membrane transport protein
MKINAPLIALALGAFAIGVTEFAPMGLLPVMAKDLDVSIPTAGLLVSVYALGVMIGAPIMTLSTSRIARHTLLVGLMGIYTLGNLFSALSTDYTTLLISRIVTSLNHGAFFGIGSVVAASLVAPDRRAGAVATMFSGLTIANIGGVPLATWVGTAVGWRTAFGGMAVIGAGVMLALWFALPRDGPHAAGDMRAELRVLKRPAVLNALAVTVLGSGAMFSVFTYIAPILHEATHVSSDFVTAMLVIYGIGLTLGNWLGGRYADRALDRTLIVVLVSLVVLLLMFAVTMRWPVAAALSIFAWGVATFALVPPVQMRVMATASDAPNLASSINIGAFNLGNALGAAVGGGVIALHLGYPAVSIAGALLAAGALVLVLTTRSSTTASVAARPA